MVLLFEIRAVATNKEGVRGSWNDNRISQADCDCGHNTFSFCGGGVTSLVTSRRSLYGFTSMHVQHCPWREAVVISPHWLLTTCDFFHLSFVFLPYRWAQGNISICLCAHTYLVWLQPSLTSGSCFRPFHYCFCTVAIAVCSFGSVW
ncbi:hypothetical protein, unlikely [Trypanosoma congolense IL3000]|uniref:Uncharacterized protein n=1 Tax=Trypanosoma congolense (strain IL3000) TaxID=1068625 RepID=F9WHV0_TRYCI|nr:hypothetical protein, unlikely [Trypanosoma congolense IL3000]